MEGDVGSKTLRMVSKGVVKQNENHKQIIETGGVQLFPESCQMQGIVGSKTLLIESKGVVRQNLKSPTSR